MTDTNVRIPKEGRDKQAVLDDMKSFGQDDAKYKDGRTWSLVYYLGEEYTDFLKQAHGLYFSENGLNPMAFKSLKRFEKDVVSMAANLFHGDHDTVGTMTSGGTESCLLAVKTYRDLARAKRPWIRHPEMIVPESIHVAFEKGAEYFGLKIVHAPVGKDFRVNVKAVKKLINRNTVMLVGSAPCYPHGVVDPIEELGRLAQKKKIPLHVDSCVGGFMLPWVEKLGYKVPPFDFRVPGVTSISADVHKYGYSAKGASVIVYRNIDYLKHQFFAYTDWSGGIYISPALLGTRPGGSIAAAWAAMQAMGENGYLERARAIMDTTRKLIDGVNAIPELQVLGEPTMSVFAYRSIDQDVNIYAVGDQMEEKGWHIDRQQKPEALHGMVSPTHAAVTEKYLQDLRDSVAFVKAHPEMGTKGNAAMYGMVAHIPMRGMIKKNVLKLMEGMYGPDGELPDIEGAGQADDLATKLGMMYVKVKSEVMKKLS